MTPYLTGPKKALCDARRNKPTSAMTALPARKAATATRTNSNSASFNQMVRERLEYRSAI